VTGVQTCALPISSLASRVVRFGTSKLHVRFVPFHVYVLSSSASSEPRGVSLVINLESPVRDPDDGKSQPSKPARPRRQKPRPKNQQTQNHERRTKNCRKSALPSPSPKTLAYSLAYTLTLCQENSGFLKASPWCLPGVAAVESWNRRSDRWASPRIVSLLIPPNGWPPPFSKSILPCA